MGWSTLPLLTDDDLGQIEPEAVATAEPWGASSWPAQRDQAKRELKVWIEADFGPGASDRIVDRWNPDYAFRYTGGAYTDITTAVSDDHEEDLDLAAALATPGTDRLYIGCRTEFDGLVVKLLDSLNAAAAVLTAKYWGPTGWTTLNASDGTAASGATFARSGRVRWSVPGNWERRRLNGTADEYFWVELAVNAALTSGTAATQIVPTVTHEGLRMVAAYLALAVICRGLAPQSGDPQEWRDRAESYHEAATALYGRLKNSGSIVLDLNNDQVAQPAERQVARPVRLHRG